MGYMISLISRSIRALGYSYQHLSRHWSVKADLFSVRTINQCKLLQAQSLKQKCYGPAIKLIQSLGCFILNKYSCKITDFIAVSYGSRLYDNSPQQRVGIVCLGSWGSEIWPQPLVSLHEQLGLVLLLEVTKQHPAKTTKLGLINWSEQNSLSSSTSHQHLFAYLCNEDIVLLPFPTYLVTCSHRHIKKFLISQVVSLENT